MKNWPPSKFCTAELDIYRLPRVHRVKTNFLLENQLPYRAFYLGPCPLCPYEIHWWTRTCWHIKVLTNTRQDKLTDMKSHQIYSSKRNLPLVLNRRITDGISLDVSWMKLKNPLWHSLRDKEPNFHAKFRNSSHKYCKRRSCRKYSQGILKVRSESSPELCCLRSSW